MFQRLGGYEGLSALGLKILIQKLRKYFSSHLPRARRSSSRLEDRETGIREAYISKSADTIGAAAYKFIREVMSAAVLEDSFSAATGGRCETADSGERHHPGAPAEGFHACPMWSAAYRESAPGDRLAE